LLRRHSISRRRLLPFSMTHLPSMFILHTPPHPNVECVPRLTFFAPPDEVLRRKHGHSDLQWSALDLDELWDGMTANPLSLLEYADLGSALDLMDNVDHPNHPGNPEKRKKIIKFILHVILSYHVIDAEYDIEKLGAHNTLPSHLKFPHLFDHQPVRLRFERLLIPPITWVNLFTKIFFGNISATNGKASFVIDVRDFLTINRICSCCEPTSHPPTVRVPGALHGPRIFFDLCMS